MNFKKTSMALIASTLLVTTLSARDQIKIVGSSTVYPFSSSVAEEFGDVVAPNSSATEDEKG